MTGAELDAIRVREQAAPAGPWRVLWNFPKTAFGIWSDEEEIVELGAIETEETAQFIAHARQDVPHLLAEVEELRRRLDEITCPNCGAKWR